METAQGNSAILSQGFEVKKSSGCFLVINWRSIANRCKFLVSSLYNVNDVAYSMA